jgi:DNA (cytosine-5)-methyltransferase 1
MRHGSLFSGIGGFDLASEWMGWENVFHCEWNEFGQKVLNYYWPNAITYHDITKTDFTIHRGRIDIITGGFPCQPYSSAGKRLGKEDERHLWPEMLRAIREIQPPYVVGENVFGLINWNGGMVFNEVQADLEAEGYEVWTYVLPACAINAPHRRDRVWFVAYNQHNGNRRREQQPESEQETNRTSENTRSNGCSNGEYEKQISKRNEWEFGTGSKERIFVGEALQYATNTNGNGLNRSNGSNSKAFSQGSILEQSNIEGQTRGFSNASPSSNWLHFPTQSPICDGDDGISDRLDSITFSKWRNESIKAGGNAIVPQVVHQIFKAIEQYNELDKQLTI